MLKDDIIQIINNGKILFKHLKKINKDIDWLLDELDIINKHQLKKIDNAYFDLKEKKIII